MRSFISYWILNNSVPRLLFLVAQKRWFSGGLKFYRRCIFFYFNHTISEIRRPIGAKLRTVVSTKPKFITPVQNFGGPTQKNLGAKTCKIWPDFGPLRSSAANISETDEDIQNLTGRFCTAISPALGDKSSVNLGPLFTEIKRWNRTHPNRLFRKNHISAPKGCCAPNFYTRHRMTKFC